nr:hypothetical protein [Tanacetum cinerariifolium]
MMRPNHQDPNTLDNMKPWKSYCFHKFTRSSYYGNDVTEMQSLGCDGEIDDMFRIRLREARSDEEIFNLVAWIRDFNINEPIYAELCHEFHSTYKFNKVCIDDELQTKKIIKFRLGGRAHSLTLLEFARRLGLYQAVELKEEGFNVYFEGGLRSDEHFNAQDYCLCQRTIVYDKIQKNDIWLLSMFDARHQNGYTNVAWVIARWMKKKGAEKKESQICCGQFISKIARKCKVLTKDVLIQEDPQPGVPRVGIPRPPRASMQDLYDRMGKMEIRQEAIEHMDFRQSYHWDSHSMTSIISSTHLGHHSISSSRMMSSVEMTRVDKQFSRRRAEANDLQQSYRCTKVGWRTDRMVKVSSSSVRLLEGVGPSISDVGKPACSLYDCSFTETTFMNNVSARVFLGWLGIGCRRHRCDQSSKIFTVAFLWEINTLRHHYRLPVSGDSLSTVRDMAANP